MGLPDDLSQATQIVSAMVVAVRMLQMSITMIERGTLFGVLMGVAGIIMIGLSAYDAARGGN